MAYIQIEYTEYRCRYNMPDFCEQCLTSYAADVGCKYCDDDRKNIHSYLSFGDCRNVESTKKYKGLSVKHYEAEESEDSYYPHLNCMILKTAKKEYLCDKVVIDGVTVYPLNKKE